MITETLDKGLLDYQVGPKIRALRTDKGLSLVRLGEHSGLSPALLSKIERGQIHPTLPTLLRIALVFGVGLDHFFVESSKQPKIAIVRSDERLALPAGSDEDGPAYLFESLDYPATNRKLTSYRVTFQARQSKPHKHEGAEMIYVIRGGVTVTIADQAIDLRAGDSLYFDSNQPHCYRGFDGSSNVAIVVVTP